MADTRKSKIHGSRFEATRRRFAEASPLAGPVYHENGVLEAEFEVLFARHWLCLTHQDAVRDPGTLVVREVGDESVIVSRDRAGVLRAFFNVCRHRGTRLVEAGEAAGLDCIRCPYHAWTYGLDGSLLAAPLMDEVDGFDKADYPLRQVRCEIWQGFVFVCFDDAAAPLAEYLADFPDVDRYGMEELRLGASHEYEIAANWKLVCENYGECYHCPANHPQLNPISHFRSGGNSFEGAHFCGGPMRLNDGCVTMTADGRTDRAPLQGTTEEDRRLVHYFNIYPAFLLAIHPDYVMTHSVWPVAPDRSVIRCDWLFAPEVVAAGGFDPSDAVDFWDLTNRQDWALCERAQKGVRSRGYEPARYHRLEETIYFFDNWYLKTMAPALLGEDDA